jgi:hypothetical protein
MGTCVDELPESPGGSRQGGSGRREESRKCLKAVS